MCNGFNELLKDRENKARFETLVGLVRQGLLSIEDAAANAGMPEEEFKEQLTQYI